MSNEALLVTGAAPGFDVGKSKGLSSDSTVTGGETRKLKTVKRKGWRQ
jgi:hypothetical protein